MGQGHVAASVTGIWLRASRNAAGVAEVQVLVEMDGKWREVNRESLAPETTISHITEANSFYDLPLPQFLA